MVYEWPSLKRERKLEGCGRTVTITKWGDAQCSDCARGGGGVVGGRGKCVMRRGLGKNSE